MLWLLGALALAAPEVGADEVLVEVARRVEAPCRPSLVRSQLANTPGRTPDDILRTIPGMHTTSPLGQGAAARYAFRGFDAGYGRDIAVSMEGVPLNEPSHIYAPGWTELSFLPRVLINQVDLCTGPAPSAGPFGVAATANFRLGLPDVGATLRLAGGTDGSGFASVAWRPRQWDSGTWIVGEVDGGEGVQGTRSWRHIRVAAGVEGNSGQVNGRAFVLLHDGIYDVPSWLRAEDIASEEVRFYGRYRPWQGEGASRRLLIGGRLTRPWDWGGIRIGAWVGARGFRLRTNPTGFLTDPTDSDALQQRQSTFEVGLSGSLSRSWRVLRDETRVEAGVDLRGTFAAQRTDDIDPRYVVTDNVADRRIQHTSLAAWTQLRLGILRHAALVPALYLAETDLRVRDDPALPVADADRAIALIAAPRVALHLSPARSVHLWGAWGRGFRPPDARNLPTTGIVPMTRVDMAQGGFDALLFARVRMEATAFGAWSPAEPVFDPSTEALLDVGPTRRVGGEGAVSVFPLPQIRLGVEASGAVATWADSGDPLPGGLSWLTAIVASAERRRVGPVLLSGGLRAWFAGPRPLPAGFRTRLQVGVDVTARVEWGRWFFDANIDQLIGARRADAEAWFLSRWDLDAPPSALPVRHLVAGQPAALTLGFGGRF